MAVSFSRTTRAIESDRGLGTRLLILVALGLLALWLGWFFLGRVSVFEVSRRARIEVTAAPRTLAAEQAGRLVASGLYIGRQVRAGEVLAAFDAAPQRLRLAEAEARLAGFPARVSAARQVLEASRVSQSGADRSAAAAVAGAGAEARAARADAAFASDLASRQRQDAEAGGIAPVDATRAALDARRAAVRGDTAALAAQRIAGDAAGTRAGRAVATAEAAAHLAALESEWRAAAAEAEQLRRAYEARLVRAPVDGVIGDVAALRLGDVLAAGERLATIVPSGGLRIVAEFDAAHSLGRLAEGQTARLRLDGFAWAEYGDVPARVERVGTEPSGDGLRVELRMPSPAPANLPLRHGMSGQVDVLVEAVSPAVLVLRTLGRSLA